MYVLGIERVNFHLMNLRLNKDKLSTRNRSSALVYSETLVCSWQFLCIQIELVPFISRSHSARD